MTGENQMNCNIYIFNCDSLYRSRLYSPSNYLNVKSIFMKYYIYLSNYFALKSENIFELYAVICHIGQSSMNGHFVAYCRNRMDKKWYLYNDGIISLCQSPNEYQKGTAYILFYQRS